MPTNRTKRTRSHRGLDHWSIDQLVTGDFTVAGVGLMQGFGSGINGLTADERAELDRRTRAAWAEHGAALLAWWRGDNERFSAVYASVGGNRRNPEIELWAAKEFGEVKTERENNAAK